MARGNSWKFLGLKLFLFAAGTQIVGSVVLHASAQAAPKSKAKAGVGVAKAADPATNFAARFAELRDKAKDLEFADLVSALAIKPPSPTHLSFDPTKVAHASAVEDALGLTDDEMGVFKKNGFVMVDHGNNLSMGQAYFQIYKADLPVFVTTDSILHALHRSYDKVLMELEQLVLIPNLQAVFTAIEPMLCPLAKEPGLRESVQDLALYSAVVRNLLSQVEPGPNAQLKYPQACGDPATLKLVMTKIGSLKADNPGGPGTALFGGPRIIDWSEFRPRGHYVQSPVLQAYFRAMMWLGRADLAWNPRSDRELRAAALLTLLANKSEQSKRLLAMSHILDFMVGRADSSGLAEMQAALEAAKIDGPAGIGSPEALASLRTAMRTVGMTGQQIRSEFIDSPPSSPGEMPLPPAIQLFGQRFVLDAFVLSKVVYDSIVFHGRKQERMMPTGLDVMAALGSSEAVLLLQPQLNAFHYSTNLLAARQMLDGLPKVEWQRNAYVRWLDALRGLFAQPDSNNFPQVMRGVEWQRKELQTTLASWAELRRDTILYAKQSRTAGIMCEYPEGFVEPYPAFYSALAALAREAAGFLGANDLDPPDAGLAKQVKRFRTGQSQFFEGFTKIMDLLEGIARKELAAQPLNPEETKLLKDVMVIHTSYGCGGPPSFSYTGWYPKLIYGVDPVKREPTVADVHTDPNSGQVLEEGVGDTRYLVIAIDNQKHHAVYVGPAYSYYEFTSNTRLTNTEWEGRIPTTKPPAFTSGFVVPPLKRSMVYSDKHSRDTAPGKL